MAAEPWQRAEIPGPIKAMVLRDPKSLVGIIKRYKKPIIIVGSEIENIAKEGFDIIEYISRLAKAINAKIIVTNSHVKEFRRRGVIEAYFMPLPSIINNVILMKEKNMVDEKPDLLIFIGFKYYYAWTFLSGLKHYAYDIADTLSLEPYYHPHAKYSLQTLPLSIWYKFLNEFINSLMISR